MATVRQRPAWRRPLVGVSGAAGRVWRWIGKSWRNVATVVLLGLAAAVGAAAGWDQDHHPLWLVAAALIAALAGAAQLSHQASPSGAPLTPAVKIGQPDGHRPSQVAMKLGATTDQQGTNFAVFCESGEAVELCLFDSAGQEQRLAMSKLTEHIWNRHVPGVGAGQRYGYRVHGLYQPASGHRFNPAKLLLDPYANAIEGGSGLG
jgi:Carbohydrate-binding module 48 (Isoamylase N-terminal domain)